MNYSAILISVAVVAAVGLFIGIFLGVASIAFRVKVDEREEKVLAALPGNNCGGCGYPGCSGLASAIIKGEAPVNARWRRSRGKRCCGYYGCGSGKYQKNGCFCEVSG